MKAKTLEYVGIFETYKDCHLYIDKRFKELVIELYNHEEGPILSVTAFIDDPSLKENEAYIDVNNNPNIMEFIQKYHLGEQKPKFKMSGYCTYPLVEFDMDIVKEYMEVKE